jgi:hypothetical protein
MNSQLIGGLMRCRLWKCIRGLAYRMGLVQGYDFTVAAKVSDPSHCLERTDAANGSFYTDCQKQ